VSGRLNDYQKSHLLVTFQYADNLLTEALEVLASAETHSPFQRHIADSLPIQRKVISDYIATLRGIMVRILDHQEVVIPQPQLSSIWAFQIALVSIRSALAELAPSTCGAMESCRLTRPTKWSWR
jgi:hypothetical protein